MNNKEIELMLSRGRVHLSYVRKHALANEHRVIATRCPKYIPKFYHRLLQKSFAKTPWCVFYIGKEHRLESVRWDEITEVF